MTRRETTRLRSPLLALLAIGLTALAMSSCGVPSDASPQIMAFDDLGGELGTSATTATVDPTPVQTAELLSRNVYFVSQANLLQSVPRDVVLTTSDDRARPVLEALIAGPNEEERGQLGLSTGLSDDIVINGIEVNGAGLAIVDLAAGQIEDLRGENLRIALAQIVYSLTELAGIESIRLRIDGADRPLATGDGSTTELVEPVTRNDYAVYRPEAVDADPTPTPDPESLPATSPDGEMLPTPDPAPTFTPLPSIPRPAPTADPTAEAQSTATPQPTPTGVPEEDVPEDNPSEDPVSEDDEPAP